MAPRNPQSGKPKKRLKKRASPVQNDRVTLYGHHAVKAALENENRQIHAVFATRNATSKVQSLLERRGLRAEEKSPKEISCLCGPEAVHQGIALSASPLKPLELEDMLEKRFLVLLDQVTDPHNVGAIARSATAMGVEGLVTTERHSTRETGLLAKTASGALDLLPFVFVVNLAQTITRLKDSGFYVIGLDSEGDLALEQTLTGDKIALVLGAEGSGLRRLTKERCDALARLDMPGAIKSLNVSNAAALSLYIVEQHLRAQK